jgi:hypothetical protein
VCEFGSKAEKLSLRNCWSASVSPVASQRGRALSCMAATHAAQQSQIGCQLGGHVDGGEVPPQTGGVGDHVGVPGIGASVLASPR